MGKRFERMKKFLMGDTKPRSDAPSYRNPHGLRGLRSWRDDEKGATFILVASAIMALTAAVGVAVDVGRGQMTQTKLQNALDAAGLAAGASINTTDLEAEVLKYVNVNFSQGTLGATITDIDPVLSADGTLLTVSATATMPTTFMQIFGDETMTIRADTEVTRTSKGMELAMVLDTTGSMAGSKISALQTASHDLLEILFGESNSTAENLWIGIVPFSMAVNVGNSHTAWLDQAHYNALDWGTTSWRGCTEARWTEGNDLTDATPTTEPFLAYYWQDDANNDWRQVDTQDVTTSTLCGPTSNNSCRCTPATGGYSGGTRVCGTVTSGQTATRTYCSNQTSSNNKRCYSEVTTQHAPIYTYSINSSRGPNTYCPVNEVTRLTNQRTTLDDAIDDLQVVGGTHIPTGAIWGWRMLSPNWRGLWGGTMNTNNLPLDYNTDLMIKAMILMTDGENTMYSTADGAYGYTGDNHVGMSAPYTDAKAAARLNVKLGDICTNMKQQGVIIYTVVFDLNSATVDTMMRNCATQPDYYFNAPDAATLRQAFRTIGDSLANLRISK